MQQIPFSLFCYIYIFHDWQSCFTPGIPKAPKFMNVPVSGFVDNGKEALKLFLHSYCF